MVPKKLTFCGLLRVVNRGERALIEESLLLQGWRNKSVVSRVKNVPVGTGRPGDFPLALLP